MATNFAELKRLRNKDLQKLTSEVTKLNEGPEKKSYEDTRFWRPAVDKSGNGYAVIRFLPSPQGEDMPWVQTFSHGFQGPSGKWYIENSLTTINQKDPVSELNSEYWNNGTEEGKEVARKQKRRLQYIANVYIVKDPSNPENEGEVKLYKFGKKIFDKLNDMMNPEFEDETPVNPFDLWEGANFKLKIRKVEGYQNYDKSEFDTSAPLSQDDDDLERIWNTEFALTEFISQTNFKTYDELKARLMFVLDRDVEFPEPTEAVEAYIPPTPKVTPTKSVEEASDDPWAKDDDDDSLTYFEKLAEG
jgi:hypothetical protein